MRAPSEAWRVVATLKAKISAPVVSRQNNVRLRDIADARMGDVNLYFFGKIARRLLERGKGTLHIRFEEE